MMTEGVAQTGKLGPPIAAAGEGVPTALSSADAFRQASTLHDAGKFLEAEALLRGAIARDPGNGDLRNARGVMFAAMGRHLDALRCYRDALACSPHAAGIWTNCGNTLNQRHFAQAVCCPVPSHTRSFTRSARLVRNTSTAPENGSWANVSWASAARPSIPLRKSTGLVATKTRTPAGGTFMPPSPRPRTAPRKLISTPGATRIIAPDLHPFPRHRNRDKIAGPPDATHRADWDGPRGAALPSAPLPQVPSSQQPSTPSPHQIIAAAAPFRSEPQCDGNFALPLANYLDNYPYPASLVTRQDQPKTLRPCKVGQRTAYGPGLEARCYRPGPRPACPRDRLSAQ